MHILEVGDAKKLIPVHLYSNKYSSMALFWTVGNLQLACTQLKLTTDAEVLGAECLNKIKPLLVGGYPTCAYGSNKCMPLSRHH